MILRGTNRSGKSRALEMLLPFLLDADRRKMDATGAARVNLDELMRTGARDQANRIGYLWLNSPAPVSTSRSARWCGTASPRAARRSGTSLRRSA